MSDTDLNAALDRFDVPPLSAGFADRVTAAAESRSRPSASWLPRGARGGWGRRASIVGGGVAFGLLSAAAAAAGYLGEPVRTAVREAPVIGPIIARVDPLPAKPKAKPAPVRVAAPRPAVKAPAVAAEPPQLERREAIVAKVRERMREGQQRRAELGLPPQRPRVQLRQALRETPPEERAEIFREYREARRERIAERWRMRQERRARWLEAQRRAESEAPMPDEGQSDLAR